MEVAVVKPLEEIPQNRFGYVQIQPDLARNQGGIQREHFLSHVVHVKQAAVRQILGVRQVRCLCSVVTNVVFKPDHFTVFPKMSGLKLARFTFPPVPASMSRASSGLGSFRPVVINDSHVLLIPNLRENAAFVPRGFPEKNSWSVIVIPY